MAQAFYLRIKLYFALKLDDFHFTHNIWSGLEWSDPLTLEKIVLENKNSITTTCWVTPNDINAFKNLRSTDLSQRCPPSRKDSIYPANQVKIWKSEKKLAKYITHITVIFLYGLVSRTKKKRKWSEYISKLVVRFTSHCIMDNGDKFPSTVLSVGTWKHTKPLEQFEIMSRLRKNTTKSNATYALFP